MFEKDNLPNTCEPEEKLVSRKQSTWTRYPGDTEFQIVQAYSYTLKNYSNAATPKLQPVNQSRFDQQQLLDCSLSGQPSGFYGLPLHPESCFG